VIVMSTSCHLRVVALAVSVKGPVGGTAAVSAASAAATPGLEDSVSPETAEASWLAKFGSTIPERWSPGLESTLTCRADVAPVDRQADCLADAQVVHRPRTQVRDERVVLTPANQTA